jgi:energy-coupling factor transport system ATP-binding protein
LVKEKLTFPQVRQRVAEALQAVNLGQMERRPIYALSGGQKQRIAIAGAIARQCEVLLLDEPTALLDTDTQQELVVQVQKLVKERGITALWVTHRLEELNYCDGAFLLENGNIVAQGDPEPLKQRLMSQERPPQAAP